MTVDAIATHGVSKRYGGVRALADVSLRVRPGEVHALLGANGAGKSTLIAVLSGAETQDSGHVEVAGQRLPVGDVIAAKRAGVMVVHQELMPFPDLTVEENVAAARLPVNWAGFVARSKRRTGVASVLAEIGLAVPLSRRAGTLTLAQQQIIEIGRALFGGGRVLILDEPTSALSHVEAEALLEVIRALAAGGKAVIFVSHRLDEAIAIADEITVLRDGEVKGTWAAGAIDVADVTHAMVGEVLASRVRVANRASADVMLTLREVRGPNLGPISLDFNAGEVTGLIGLEGAGTDRLLRVLGGVTPSVGEVSLRGQRLHFTHPADALRAGLVYMPPDRKLEGLWLDRSPVWNIATAAVRRVPVWGWPGWVALRESARRKMAEFGVRLSAAEQPVRFLSGGNQQRVLFARAVAQGPRMLLLSDPSRGVDVKAKAAIHDMIADLAGRGMAVCVAGSDIEEILELAHRIVCMRGGRIVASGPRQEFGPTRIMECISGSYDTG
jgi:ABC-type sugar transport system ATPase subunit